MLFFILLSIYSPKLIMSFDGGVGCSYGLPERNNAPYHTNLNNTLCGGMNSEIGINILIVDLTFLGGLPGGTPTRSDKINNQWDKWGSFEGGGKIALRLPTVANLIVSKIGIKYIWRDEYYEQQNALFEFINKEEYSAWGIGPDINITFSVPKKSWKLDFIYGCQDFGTITLKEEVSGKNYYENLVISNYSIGFYIPIDFPNPNLPTGKEKIPFGIIYSSINKSDGRSDWFIGISMKTFE